MKQTNTTLKNVPKTIYLHIGDDDFSDVVSDFKELSEVSWSDDRIYPNDLEYRLVESQAEQKTAEQVLQEHYGKHGQCTIQQAKFVRWEDAINAMEAYAAQYKEQVTPVAPNEKLYRWVKASERNPNKSGMYITHVRIEDEMGVHYFPVSYNRYDADLKKWWPYPKACSHRGDLVEWLEQLTPEQATTVAEATVAPIAEGEGFDYPAAARAIALWLEKYCNEELPYPEMIADAARKVKQDRDNWVEMWRTSCDEIKFYKRFVEKERKVTKESLQLRQQLASLQAENAELRKKNDWLLNRR